jgi:hypothetical protein
MKRTRGLLGLATAAILLALGAKSVRAGILEMDVTFMNGTGMPMLQGGALDTAMNPDAVTAAARSASSAPGQFQDSPVVTAAVPERTSTRPVATGFMPLILCWLCRRRRWRARSMA